MYTQRPIRMNQMNTNNNTSNNAGTPPQSNPAHRIQYQIQRDRLMQQQQKERLLQQQQKQSLVVPVNATAGADQLCTFSFDDFNLLICLATI